MNEPDDFVYSPKLRFSSKLLIGEVVFIVLQFCALNPYLFADGGNPDLQLFLLGIFALTAAQIVVIALCKIGAEIVRGIRKYTIKGDRKNVRPQV